MATAWPQRTWAIEDAHNHGRLLAQQLVAAGETVLDLPAKLTARVRVLDRGANRKTDGIDAAAVALVALRRKDLHQLREDDHVTVFRLPVERRT